ncbi:MAG: hypothetical protein RL653_2940 [Pseudomonadota bacterium]|jgi:serine/threonine protein kinase
MGLPQSFGRYELLRKLATGGMGEIYLARQAGPVGFEKLLVVKRILPHLSEEDEFIQMFFDEARIAAALNHPNVAQLFDLGEVDGSHYIAMEYVAGESTRAVRARCNERGEPLPIGLACRVFADAACGLDFAHSARSSNGAPLQLIHRDVSPQNILVAFNGAVKLIDFGVAKAAGKLTHTATGAVKGKYAYMSPEQAKGEPLDGRSDLFGLATVFWETLTGERLWKRDSELNTMKAVVKEPAPPPSSVNPDVSPALDALVLKALQKKRNDRFASCGEFQLAVEDFVISERLPATTRHLSLWMLKMFAEEAAVANTNPVPPLNHTPMYRRKAFPAAPAVEKPREPSQGGRRLVPRKK